MAPSDSNKALVLIGLMGSGKSAIGRLVAAKLARPFFDSDRVIEEEAGKRVKEIFAHEGEAAFRVREKAVVERLLALPGGPVVASGGGVFMNPELRALIKEKAIAVWLRADLELLLARTGRKRTRPLLLTGDPREILSRLIDERYPIYAEAHVTLDSGRQTKATMVKNVITALQQQGYLDHDR